jgi:hypothetical protein
MSIFNNDDYEDDYNFIQGVPLTEKEQNKINFLINFDFKNKNDNEIYFIINTYTHNIFNIHDDIKYNKLKFVIIEKNKNKYWKYEDDDKLYIITYSSYLEMKKKLFCYLKPLLILLNNNIHDDIKNYLNNKFLNNINKCKYYDCLKWFSCLFIYFVKLINQLDFNCYKINYKDFRKYILEFRKNKTNYDIMNDILNDFIKIDYKFKYYEELKALLDFSIYHIYDHNYILP